MATAPGRFEADPFESGVDGDHGEQHPHADDRAGDRVAECGRPCGEFGHRRPSEAAPVGEQCGQDQAHERGDRDELQAVPQVLGELVEQRCAAAGFAVRRSAHTISCRVGPTKATKTTSAHAPVAAAPRAPVKRAATMSAVGATGLAVSGASAADTFESDRQHGEREHDEREFAGGVAVVRASPDPEHTDRHGVDAEVLHGREIGECLHHHHRRARRRSRVGRAGARPVSSIRRARRPAIGP